MKVYGEKYQAMCMGSVGNVGSYLYTESNTLEGVRMEIDKSNKRVVELGYKPSQYLITHTEYSTYYADDDFKIFTRREEIEVAVEVYPTEI